MPVILFWHFFHVYYFKFLTEQRVYSFYNDMIFFVSYHLLAFGTVKIF